MTAGAMNKTSKAEQSLDVLTAERVMGWHLEDTGHSVKFWVDLDDLLTGWCNKDWPDEDDWGDAPGLFSGNGVWKPSTDIAVAWVVVGQLIANGATPQIYYSSGQWWACLGGLNAAAGGETAPLAICRAALEAMQ